MGGTGATGSATLHSLLSKPDTYEELRILVRSKAKLLRLFPQLEGDPKAKIWEGQLNNLAMMVDCFETANVIICTLGENRNIPGHSLLQDASKTIIAALTLLEQQSKWQKPRFIFLSAAPLNPRFASAEPSLVHWILKTAFHYSYHDVEEATATLSASPRLLSLLLVQPPAIVEEHATGHVISTDTIQPIVSYADLGAAFADLALERSYDELGAVGVYSKGAAPGKFVFELLLRIIVGLISGYFPGYWTLRSWLGGI